jgi:hypothetical protein
MMKNSLPNHIAGAFFVHIKICFYLSTNVGGNYTKYARIVQYLFVCRCIRPSQSLNSERVLHYAMRSKIQF